MSITIVGGNDCMVTKYKDLCKQYSCKAKVYTQPSSQMRKQIGGTDLLIFFTNTVSHKMVKAALAATSGKCPNIVRCHSSSMSALKDILEEHAC
ncbi:MAG: DUF2325 domain-containing protein [Eubacteriales bacterium]